MSGQVHSPADLLPQLPIQSESGWVPEPDGMLWRRDTPLAPARNQTTSPLTNENMRTFPCDVLHTALVINDKQCSVTVCIHLVSFKTHRVYLRFWDHCTLTIRVVWNQRCIVWYIGTSVAEELLLLSSGVSWRQFIACHSKLLWNFCTYKPIYTASHPRRWQFSIYTTAYHYFTHFHQNEEPPFFHTQTST